MMNSPHPDLDSHQTTTTGSSIGSVAHGALESAEALGHRAAERTRQQAVRLRDAGSAHIREHPLQSVLIAAAAGAVLLLLTELVVRASRSSR